MGLKYSFLKKDTKFHKIFEIFKLEKNLVTLDFGSHIWVARRGAFMQHCANYIFRYLIGWTKMP